MNRLLHARNAGFPKTKQCLPISVNSSIAARIAHELHDDTVQSLVAIAQSLDLASNWIQRDPEHAAGMLKMAPTQAVETVEGLRRLIADLLPPALEELGLIPALQMLAENEDEIAVTVKATGKERRLYGPRELTLFRSVQEAIRNAQRHGEAKNITVEVDYHPQYGLLGMHERVHHLNGDIHVSSKPGQGTELIVMLPLDTIDQPTEAVRDPVCAAIIQPQQAYGSVQYKDQRYYFCCPVCQGAFQSDAEMYLVSR